MLLPRRHLLLLSLSLSATANSIPEDLYSFPKFRVSFLNGLPVTNETAELWLKDGVVASENVFMRREESVEDANQVSLTPVPSSPNDGIPIKVQHMRLGSSASYICLVPPGSTLKVEEKEEEPIHPSKSWELLEPLTERCLYHKQGWFTYSYCHHRQVRQFREQPHSHPHPPGGRIPEEDPDWEAYTLGISPTPPGSTKFNSSTTDSSSAGSTSTDVTATLQAQETETLASAEKENVGGGEVRMYNLEEAAMLNEVELATGAGQRYLVQRWRDGTECKNTGRRREVEIQFHCSMTTTDAILFIKETVTCQYTLVIHTPRLCGQPGFRSERDILQETEIKCREVVDSIVPASSEQHLEAAQLQDQSQGQGQHYAPNSRTPAHGRVLPSGLLPPKPMLEKNRRMPSEEVKMEEVAPDTVKKDTTDLLKAALEKLMKKAQEMDKKLKDSKEKGGSVKDGKGAAADSERVVEAVKGKKKGSKASIQDLIEEAYEKATSLEGDDKTSVYEVEGLGDEDSQVVVVDVGYADMDMLFGDDQELFMKHLKKKLEEVKKGKGSSGKKGTVKKEKVTVSDMLQEQEQEQEQEKAKEKAKDEPKQPVAEERAPIEGHDEL